MPLSEAEIRERLKSLPGWDLVGKAIQKRFSLRSFVPAMQFVNKVAELAEAEQHHPDIAINYNLVTLVLSTHSEGGVTVKDMAVASKIESIKI